MIDASSVSTVDDLRTWLRDHVDHWDTYGWINDPGVADRDGRTVFVPLSDGGVFVGNWSRGKIESGSPFPSEREATQAALAEPLITLVQKNLKSLRIQDQVFALIHPSSAVGRPDNPPPEGVWAVVADRSTLLICYMAGTEMHVQGRTSDPEEAARIVAELHAQGPPPTSEPQGSSSS